MHCTRRYKYCIVSNKSLTFRLSSSSIIATQLFNTKYINSWPVAQYISKFNKDRFTWKCNILLSWIKLRSIVFEMVTFAKIMKNSEWKRFLFYDLHQSITTNIICQHLTEFEVRGKSVHWYKSYKFQQNKVVGRYTP